MNMTYKDVIKDRQPLYEGDFFRQYKINGKQFVLYKNTFSEVRCIELCRFLELSPELLMTYIDEDGIEETKDEFNFEVEIMKEDVLKYLFDVESVTSGRYVPHISSKAGYVLSESIFKNEINQINDEDELIYDNALVYCSNIKNEAKEIHIATDVSTYDKLNIDVSIQGTTYLIATNSIYFFNRIDFGNCDVYIYAKNNMLHSLSIYMKLYNLLCNYSFIVEYDSSQVVISFVFPYLSAEDLMQLLSFAESFFPQKGSYDNKPKLHYNVILGDLDNGKIHTVYFPNTKKHVSAFLKAFSNERINVNINKSNVHLIV